MRGLHNDVEKRREFEEMRLSLSAGEGYHSYYH